MNVQLSLSQLKEWTQGIGDDTQVYFKQDQPSGVSGESQVTDVRPLEGRKAASGLASLSDAQGVDAKAARRNARRSFLNFIKTQCGLPTDCKITDLPPNVQKAMKCAGIGGLFHRLSDWGDDSAHPLTARRIKTVLAAIDAYAQEHAVPCSKFFSPANHTEGITFMKLWNVTEKNTRGEFELFGDNTANMILCLNNLDSKNYPAIGAALNILGPACRPNTLYSISRHVNEINAAMKNGGLDAQKLFTILSGKEKVPAELQKAVESGNRQQIAAALIETLDADLFKVRNQVPSSDKALATQLASRVPVFENCAQLTQFLRDLKDDSKRDDAIQHMKAEIRAFCGACGSIESPKIEDALGEIFRANSNSIRSPMTFVHSGTGETSDFVIEANMNDCRNADKVKDFSDKIDAFTRKARFDDRMKGLLIMAFKQQGCSLPRVLGQAICGFQPEIRQETLKRTITDNDDGTLTFDIRSCDGRVDGHKGMDGKMEFFNVKMHFNFTFHPDGRQTINTMEWDMTKNETAQETYPPRVDKSIDPSKVKLTKVKLTWSDN